MSSLPGNQESSFDTLRLSMRDVEMILAALDSQDGKFSGARTSP